MNEYNFNNFKEKTKEQKSFATDKLQLLQNTMLKNFLYNLWNGNIKEEKIKVVKLLGLTSYEVPMAHPPALNFNDLAKNYSFSDLIFLATIEYKSEVYEIVIHTLLTREYSVNSNKVLDYIFVNGVTDNASFAKVLLREILDKSVLHSSFNNAVIKLDNSIPEKEFHNKLNIIKPNEMKLENLYLPEIKKDQIKRFINSVNNFEKDKISLKYLLNGKPGTGKTQIINSVINEVYGKATILITNGGNLPLNDIFRF